MRNFALFVLTSISLLIFFCFPVYASSFDTSYLRLVNQRANSTIKATVCAKPSSQAAGAENKVLITFPDSFTISQTASNWTTDTTNLPLGATVWPSIGSSATSVSGQTVTFSTTDLTTNSLFCFNLSSSQSTTGSANNDQVGFITTKNSSNSIIDTDDYALSIPNNNQVNITASVGVNVSELPIAIESTTPGSQFSQDSEISYKITYGSNTSEPIPLKVQVQWSQGTISGNSTPTLDILDYVVGSASNAYNSTPPVVDTVNRTITWTISSFPENTTSKTVTLKLKTNDSYTGSSTVNFDVSARLMSGSTITPDETVFQSYLFHATYQDTSPSATPTPSPSTIDTNIPLTISEISITSISQSSAEIFVSTNKSATLVIQYGTTPQLLSKSIETLSEETENSIIFPDLLPDTTYYFRIIAKDSIGFTKESDIFTFKTAVISDLPQIDLRSILVTSNSNIILNPALNKDLDKFPVIVLPRESLFQIQFSLKKFTNIKNIYAIIRDSKVLGFSIPQAYANTSIITFVETQPGVYTGSLSSGQKTGLYEIYLKIADYNGNLTEIKIADLKVTTKISVFNKDTHKPIESARMLLYLYLERTRIYEIISQTILPIQNPSYSGSDGRFDIVLPYGKYKAEVSAIGFSRIKVEFEVGPNGNYPTIYLKAQGFNLFNSISYYNDTFRDGFSAAQNYIQIFARSNRFFDLVNLISLIFFIVVTLIAFSARTHISVFKIPYFLFHRIKLAIKKDSNTMFGKVFEKGSKLPTSRANIYLINSDNKTIAHTQTNKMGEFYFTKPNLSSYKIMIIKKGFSTTEKLISSSHVKQDLAFEIEKSSDSKPSIMEYVMLYVEGFFGLMLESLLFIELVFEFFFIFTFGFIKVLPFITLSSLTILLIFFFIYKPRSIT